ncbi:hypothetical protein EDD22DRAFT_931340, partial [Suillus occidentalis]
GLPYCGFAISSPPSLVPSLSAYSRLFRFTWLIGVTLLIFSSLHQHAIGGLRAIGRSDSKSSAQCPQDLLYSVGISMSIKLKTLDISCSHHPAILWYVLLLAPTSRSGRPISLKERGRLPGWYSSKIFQGEQQKYLTKVEQFTKKNMEIECSSNSCLSHASNARHLP